MNPKKESFLMRMTFAGTGSAFTVGDGNYQSNMVLEDEHGYKMLIDCGSDIRFSLFELGLSYDDIDAVYISHLHADHVGGLEWLAFTTMYQSSSRKKPHLFIHTHLLDDLWDHSLSGGLSSVSSIDNVESLESINDYFEVHPIVNKTFSWRGHPFEIFAAPHSMTGCYHNASYGLNFTVGTKKIMITTDSKFEPEMMKNHYDKADVIFQDCEIFPTKSTIHAHYSELVTLSPKIKNKMWLYGYQPMPLQDAKKDGFLGFVKKGQVFDW